MTLAEILAALVPAADAVRQMDCGVIAGEGRLAADKPLPGNGRVHILGIVGGVAVGVERALALADHVLRIASTADDTPIVLLIDCGSQRMRKRDELLGLNEYLAHLAKTLLLAELSGHRTIALLYGHAAAGAFIATGLAAGSLLATRGAQPEVMDLPSMARVTKLSLDTLKAKAKTTPVFAPGIDNLFATGAVLDQVRVAEALVPSIAALLRAPRVGDERDQLGLQRGGRPKAALVAMQIAARARHV